MKDYKHLVERLTAPLFPLDTSMEPQLNALSGIKAVLVDIYGTVLISGSGDVGTVSEHQPAIDFYHALEANGVHCEKDLAEQGPGLIKEAILQTQKALTYSGVDVPEVNILNIWKTVLEKLSLEADDDLISAIALTYECRVNPVWPMPHVADALVSIKNSPMQMGIVSNAQFYTPIIMETLLGQSLNDLGFDLGLCSWSWKESRSKPSVAMFEKPLNTLVSKHGIKPHEVVYIGNDMLNDVWTASQCGCKTILFAGDQRSLRMRDNDERCNQGLTADAVMTHWNQLPEILPELKS